MHHTRVHLCSNPNNQLLVCQNAQFAPNQMSSPSMVRNPCKCNLQIVQSPPALHKSSFHVTSLHSLHAPYHDLRAQVGLGVGVDDVLLFVGVGSPAAVDAGVVGAVGFVVVVDVELVSLQPNQPGDLQAVVVTGDVELDLVVLVVMVVVVAVVAVAVSSLQPNQPGVRQVVVVVVVVSVTVVVDLCLLVVDSSKHPHQPGVLQVVVRVAVDVVELLDDVVVIE